MDKELEIYIHMPFCARKCNYCDFLSAPQTQDVIESYIYKLINEIAARSGFFREYEVSTIFIGGGTPSVVDPYLIKQVLETVKRYYYVRMDAEITIECNPGSTLRHKFSVYRESGINRLSIGLQSADNYELKVLGRIHSFEEFLKCYQGARMEGFDNINIDLMNCFPSQTPSTWRKTLKNVLMLKPEHLSVYNLIVEEGTPIKKMIECGSLKMPTEDVAAEIDSVTAELTSKYKFDRYEISNYARPGYECRHNKGYWTGTEYIGFGLGASSLIKNIRFKNTSDLYTYLNKDFRELSLETFIDSEEEIERLSDEERMREFMILGLRLTEGIKDLDFFVRFGKQVDDVYGGVLKKYEETGLIERPERSIRLTDRGLDLANLVMGEF
ncbi:MAG: radical SAM family heme chaperone HemW [Eubacteriales bacterium]|nr:radical SAM family heme chaperone HemW [Eubacteriales bacterium]